jgi:DNA-binding MarR family transcriptional regulator
MREKRHAGGRPVEAVAAGSLRRRILEYIDQEGGELRSDSGLGLRRQICDALGERPTRVSHALIALERGGLLEREMDLQRHRCQAIRLVVRETTPRPLVDVERLMVDSALRADLEAAERELSDLIRRAAAAARRVGDLRWAVLQADDPEHVAVR